MDNFDYTTSPPSCLNEVVNTIPPECRFRLVVCKLAEDFLVSTRVLVFSIAANSKETAYAIERLRRNYLDIGAMIELYFGPDISSETTRLLKAQTEQKHKFLDAIKSGDIERTEKVKKQLYENTDSISASLGMSISSYLSQAQMKKYLRRLIDLTGQLLQFRMDGRWSEEINAYDRLHEYCLGVSDMLSSGIIKQFPEKFKDNRNPYS